MVSHLIYHTYPIARTTSWLACLTSRHMSPHLSCWPGTSRSLGAHCQYKTLRPRQNGRHFPDDIFKCIFLNENVPISITVSPKFVPKGLINNIPALVQIMAWRRPGDKPLSEPLMVSLLTHMCFTRPQWVKTAIQIRLLPGKHLNYIWIKSWTQIIVLARS